MFRQPPRPDQRGPALQTNSQQYMQALPVPSPYGQHLEVPQHQSYPDQRHGQIDYQQSAQPFQALSGVAAYSHAQRNGMHPNPAPHTYNMHAPAYQQRIQTYDARPPAQQQQDMETNDTRTRVPPQHTEMYDRVPAPQQGAAYTVEYHDNRVTYPSGDQQGMRPIPYLHQNLVPGHDGCGMHEGWQPQYGSMAYQAAENVRTPRSSPRMSPLPGLMEYSSSPAQSEVLPVEQNEVFEVRAVRTLVEQEAFEVQEHSERPSDK
ncbi:uncharacterized protein F5147DRAFT_654558 [Suillus discolor]|uniref:Uncharacterized protein n=1 Tax=Suillus discolor TaxID=1912936 RepID=A0A9P7F257_9AGAM|nr:uncharacterized protein F5147DRAFT_654558 [Suillus discolor]KAG2104046.1 hypothetical protein F5147DRAFT_654558 [Suillus discolor]